ncbi:hypothetical protein [Nonomuraea bangladeshensis]|uniref:hypothetical protein n=1 Tax=Nonomuraea bangladeshensis TaxID=404385 RepID=UPI003C2B5086
MLSAAWSRSAKQATGDCGFFSKKRGRGIADASWSISSRKLLSLVPEPGEPAGWRPAWHPRRVRHHPPLLHRGADPDNKYGFAPLSEEALRALERRLGGHGLVNHGPNYLASIIKSMEDEDSKSGRTQFRRLTRSAVEMLRVGYEFERIQQEWLYQEIGGNIAKLMGERLG